MRGVIAVVWLNAETQARAPAVLAVRASCLLGAAFALSWESAPLLTDFWNQAMVLAILIGLTAATSLDDGHDHAASMWLPATPLTARAGLLLGQQLPMFAVLALLTAASWITSALWFPALIEATAAGALHPAWLALVADPALLGVDPAGRAIALGLPLPWRGVATASLFSLLMASFRLLRADDPEPLRFVVFNAWLLTIAAWMFVLPSETLLERLAPITCVAVPLTVWASARPDLPLMWPSLEEPSPGAPPGPAWTASPRRLLLAARQWLYAPPTLHRRPYRAPSVALLHNVLIRPSWWHVVAPVVGGTLALLVLFDVLLFALLRPVFPVAAGTIWILQPFPVLLFVGGALTVGIASILGGFNLFINHTSGDVAEAIDLLPVTRARIVAEIWLHTLVVTLLTQVGLTLLPESALTEARIAAPVLQVLSASACLAMLLRPSRRTTLAAWAFVAGTVALMALVLLTDSFPVYAAVAWTAMNFVGTSLLAVQRPPCA